MKKPFNMKRFIFTLLMIFISFFSFSQKFKTAGDVCYNTFYKMYWDEKQSDYIPYEKGNRIFCFVYIKIYGYNYEIIQMLENNQVLAQDTIVHTSYRDVNGLKYCSIYMSEHQQLSVDMNNSDTLRLHSNLVNGRYQEMILFLNDKKNK